MEARTEIEPHPEDYCQICKGKNVCWYAPNEIFNSVNGNDIGIMCPQCFEKMAKEKGYDKLIFRVEDLASSQPDLIGKLKEAKELLEKLFQMNMCSIKGDELITDFLQQLTNPENQDKK